MTAVAELEERLGTGSAPARATADGSSPGRPDGSGADSPGHRWRRYRTPALATALAAVNAAIFLIVRPGVEDLWAARAREYAAQHGVGLTYWFGWFSGGSTPGNYSVITPYLSAVVSAEVLGAVSALAITVLCVPLLRGTRYADAGVLLAAVGAGSNLWSGRIPFLLGTACTVAALLAVRHQRRAAAGLAGVLAVFASPVSGAFLALGLVAVFASRRSYRTISTTTLVAVLVSLVLVAVVFGNPGPESFGALQCLALLGATALCLFARPPGFLRSALVMTLAVTVVLLVIPNGMGSNLSRLVWFFFPVAVVALGGRRLWVLLLLVAPLVGAGVYGAVSDVRAATRPMSSPAYYAELSSQLDRMPQLRSFRLEVVTEGSHAADTALLDHAMLARGWETQADDSLNSILMSKTLDAATYQIWLEDNAVGYIAVPRAQSSFPEYQLVTSGTLGYLDEVWSNVDWTLYSVSDAQPVVSSPASMVAHSQSRLTMDVPCACSFTVRVRYSKFLRASATSGPVHANVVDNGSGWTMVTTTAPGDYYLYGTMTGLFD